MIAILDVSAAVEIILDKEKKDKFLEAIEASEIALAPDLFIAEIANVFWKLQKANLVTHNDCVQYVEDGLTLVDDLVDARDLWKEALGESVRNNHPVYDMLYAVLARRNDATLITNDRALFGICSKLNINCLF